MSINVSGSSMYIQVRDSAGDVSPTSWLFYHINTLHYGHQKAPWSLIRWYIYNHLCKISRFVSQTQLRNSATNCCTPSVWFKLDTVSQRWVDDTHHCYFNPLATFHIQLIKYCKLLEFICSSFVCRNSEIIQVARWQWLGWSVPNVMHKSEAGN